MDDLRNDIIALIQQIRYEEWKKSASIDLKHKSVIRARIEDHVAFCDYLIDCISKIDAAPTVQPERQAGRWVLKETKGAFYIECSQCGGIIWYDPEVFMFGYCPLCGARMAP